MATLTLPPALRSLCGQVAAERLRRQVWDAGAALRADALQRLLDGASIPQVTAWLQSEHSKALAQQAART